MRGAQASLSPNLGAPIKPAEWQTVHTALNTCSPVLPAGAASLVETTSGAAEGAAGFSAASAFVSVLATGATATFLGSAAGVAGFASAAGAELAAAAGAAEPPPITPPASGALKLAPPLFAM